ncbi:hypothetical protein MTO96_038400 [Rhipicephalus appendiculatus]
MGITNSNGPKRRRTPTVTIIDAAYGACNLATSSACAWQAWVILPWVLRRNVTSILRFIDFSLLCGFCVVLIVSVISSVCARWRQLGAPLLLSGCHFLHVVAVITDVLMASQSFPAVTYSQSWWTASNAVLVTTISGSFLCSSLQDAPVVASFEEADSDRNEDTHSVLRRLICTAVFRHIWNAAYCLKTVREDLPVLGRDMHCRYQVNALKRLQDKYHGFGKPARFITCVLRVLWRDILSCIVVNFAYYASLLARIPILERLLEANDTSELLPLVTLFLASCAAEFVLGCVEAERIHILSGRTKSLCQGALFIKMTRMSIHTLPSYPAGHIIALMAVDCTHISVAVAGVPKVAVGVLCTPLVLFSVWRRIGTLPVLCCAAWQLLTFFLLIPFVKLQKKLWLRKLKWHDGRLRKIADILSSVRLVKLYAWEETFAASVTELRSREVHEQFTSNLVDGLMDCIFVSSSSVVRQ